MARYGFKVTIEVDVWYSDEDATPEQTWPQLKEYVRGFDDEDVKTILIDSYPRTNEIIEGSKITIERVEDEVNS